MISDNSFIELAYTFVRIRNLDELLDTVLGSIRNMLSADAGSIFIYDEENDELIFSYTQNDSLDLPFKKFRMKANEQSIAGFCAVRKEILRLDDVYDLDPKFPFRFNQSFDDMSGYCTRSMLVFPITDISGGLIGVLQLINKRKKNVPVNKDTADEAVGVFTVEDAHTAHSLSGIIGMALENALLYDSIEAMWEGFIQACMTAIDSRDPVTGGHSERVTSLTMAIAEAMSDDDETFPDFVLTPAQLRSLKYSCMLHDFGKLVISENVLQKADKLYPGMMDVIKYRFAMAKAVAKAEGKPQSVTDELNTLLEKVYMANIPTVLDADTSEGLDRCLHYFFEDTEGHTHQLLTEKEYSYLSIKRGSLTESERDVIMSHVLHTYEFLKKIPWTKELKQVPEVAAMHHERISGNGYPFGLKGEEVVIPGRIMAIADIYDALTAQDRPYKKAMPVEKACAILIEEAERNVLDIDIVQFFIKNEIYKCLDRR